MKRYNVMDTAYVDDATIYAAWEKLHYAARAAMCDMDTRVLCRLANTEGNNLINEAATEELEARQ